MFIPVGRAVQYCNVQYCTLRTHQGSEAGMVQGTGLLNIYCYAPKQSEILEKEKLIAFIIFMEYIHIT